jgi:hypothetical protein
MCFRSILAFATLALLPPFSSAEVRLYLTPLSSPVSVGGTLNVGLGVSGLDFAPAIAGYDVTILFDSERVKFQGIHLGDPQRGDQLHFDQTAPPPQSITHHEPGEIHLIESSLDPTNSLEESQAESFLMAILNFEAQLVGRTLFSLNVNGLSGSAAEMLTAEAVGTSVFIVPVPPASILMTTGLLTLLVCVAVRSASQAQI